MPKYKVHIILDETLEFEAETEGDAEQLAWDEVFEAGYAGVSIQCLDEEEDAPNAL